MNIAEFDKEKRATEEVSRGRLAEQVISNPIFREAFVIIRADLMLKFEQSTFKQADERDEIWRRLNNLNKLEQLIKEVMLTGEMGKKTLSLLDKFKR